MIVAIIPARGGSKGIPKKNITEFCGKPLIYWTIKQAYDSELIDYVYISTDSKEIRDLVEGFQFDRVIVIDRPKELSTDTSSSESAIAHTLSLIDDGTVESVVFLQATSPLRFKEDIDQAIRLFNTGYDSLFSASLVEDITLWDSAENSVTYDWKSRGRRQDRPQYYLENGSIYVFKPKVLFDTNNRLGGKKGMYLMNSWQSFEIDDADGLDLCKYYMNFKLLGK